MLTEINFPEDRFYKTGLPNQPTKFYNDVLNNSNQLDLLLGKLSLNSINPLASGFATFIRNMGKMRIVFNLPFEQVELKEYLKLLDEVGKHFFNCIAWMISHHRIRIIDLKNGIAPYKTGIFSDGVNSILFDSSTDFNSHGWLENFEEVEVYLSWEEGRSMKLINKRTNDFEKILCENNDSAELVNAIVIQFGNKSLNELLIQEKILVKKLGFINAD
jgi:hypothetical protein